MKLKCLVLYGTCILQVVDSVLTTMNRHYRNYVEHHPLFTTHGRVSLLAHSLGSVIAYDILATQAWGSDTHWIGQKPSCGERLAFPVSCANVVCAP